MMTDLELVYLGHVADLLDWNIKADLIKLQSDILVYHFENMHP